MKHGFGIIGAGGIADVHARAVQAITGTGPSGVYDIDPERSLSFGNRYSCKIFKSPDDLCRDPDIDIVWICTHSGHHLEPALKAISEWKHCIIEKPLEITLERCDRIIEEGIKKNVIISGIFPMRFSDVNRELRKAIDSGRFGKFVLGDVYVKWFRDQAYYNDVKWRGSISDGGGGAVMNQGIHSVDLLQWFMGKVDSVCAFTSSPGHEDIEVEDTAVAVLRFNNGALGVIEASTAVNPGFFRKIEILGTKGSVVLEEES
jgi:predicted dehydrogenase